MLFVAVFTNPGIAVGGEMGDAVQAALSASRTGNVDQAKRILGTAMDRKDISPEHRHSLAVVLGEICLVIDDHYCILEASKKLQENWPVLKDLPLEAEQRLLLYYDALFFSGAVISFAGDESARREFINNLRENYPGLLAVSTGAYIRMSLLEADLLLADQSVNEARFAIDRGFAMLLSTNHLDRDFLAARLTEILGLLVRVDQPERARRLLVVAEEFLSSTFKNSLPDRMVLNRTAGDIHYFAAPGKALRAYESFLVAAQGLIAPLYLVEFFVSRAAIDVASVCILLEDFACSSQALDAHPTAKSAEDLATAGYFLRSSHFEYAAARITSSLGSSVVPETWFAALGQPPQDMDAPMMADFWMSIGLFARGLAAEKHTGIEVEIQEEFVRAGSKLAAFVARDIEFSHQGFPLPGFLDQAISGRALQALTNRADWTDSGDLAIGLMEIKNRSIRDVDGQRLELLARAQTVPSRRQVHSALRLESRQFRNERSRLLEVVNQLSKGAVGSRTRTQPYDYDVFGQFRDYAIERRRLWRSIESEGLLGAPGLVELSALQAELDPAEAIVATTRVADRHVHVCVTAESLSIFQKPFDSALFKKHLRAVWGAVLREGPPSIVSDSQFPNASAEYLYANLLGPVEDCLSKAEHLIWIPYDDLVTFPLGALLMPAADKGKASEGLDRAPWLALEMDLSIVTSFAHFLYARKLSARHSPPLQFFGIGDPVLERPAPSEGSWASALAKRSAPSRSGERITLQELPDTGEELRNIAASSDGISTVLTRLDATEIQFRSRLLNQYQAFSFATHGLIRADMEGLAEAALVLTPVSESDSRNDGLLSASEVADLNLHAKLAFLSACNTANFDQSLLQGELEGLTTAFAIAGVPTVIASAWPIESRSARLLAESYFRKFFDSESPSSAARSLRMALQEFLREPPTRAHLHPRFWAPFLLYGNGSVTIEQPVDRSHLREVDSLFVGELKVGGWYTNLKHAGPTNGLYFGGLADPVERRFQGTVTRVEPDGTESWTYFDRHVGSIRILRADSAGVIAGGFRSSASGKSVPAILRLGPSGDLLWGQTIDSGPVSSFILDAVKLVEGGLMLLIGSPREEFGSSLLLVELSSEGEFLRKATINLDQTIDWRASGLSQFESDLLIYSYGVTGESPRFTDEYGLVVFCDPKSLSTLIRLDFDTLAETGRSTYENLEIVDLKQARDGRVFGAANIPAGCGGRTTAALVEVLSSGAVKVRGREKGPLHSRAGKVVLLDNGRAALLGHSDRRFGLISSGRSWWQGSDADFEPEDVFHTTDNKSGITDSFVSFFSAELTLEQQVWLQGGADTLIEDGIWTGLSLELAGSIGSQPIRISIE